MTDFKVKVLEKVPVTHNVFRLRFERPAGYEFKAGQATELAVDAPGFTDRKAPFTFTGLEKDPFLELTFKSYPEHNGVTKKMAELSQGDTVIIGDAWDSYIYKGPGMFIAGGAGITPFLAIFRQLKLENRLKGNRLFFSNHAKEDVILEEELRGMLGENCVFLLTKEWKSGYHFGRVDEEFLRNTITNFNQPFYLCGPDPFVDDIRNALLHLGAKKENIITSL